MADDNLQVPPTATLLVATSHGGLGLKYMTSLYPDEMPWLEVRRDPILPVAPTSSDSSSTPRQGEDGSVTPPPAVVEPAANPFAAFAAAVPQLDSAEATPSAAAHGASNPFGSAGSTNPFAQGGKQGEGTSDNPFTTSSSDNPFAAPSQHEGKDGTDPTGASTPPNPFALGGKQEEDASDNPFTATSSDNPFAAPSQHEGKDGTDPTGASAVPNPFALGGKQGEATGSSDNPFTTTSSDNPFAAPPQHEGKDGTDPTSASAVPNPFALGGKQGEATGSSDNPFAAPPLHEASTSTSNAFAAFGLASASTPPTADNPFAVPSSTSLEATPGAGAGAGAGSGAAASTGAGAEASTVVVHTSPPEIGECGDVEADDRIRLLAGGRMWVPSDVPFAEFRQRKPDHLVASTPRSPFLLGWSESHGVSFTVTPKGRRHEMALRKGGGGVFFIFPLLTVVVACTQAWSCLRLPRQNPLAMPRSTQSATLSRGFQCPNLASSRCPVVPRRTLCIDAAGIMRLLSTAASHGLWLPPRCFLFVCCLLLQNRVDCVD